MIVVVVPEPSAVWLPQLAAAAAGDEERVVLLALGGWRATLLRLAVRTWVRGAADRRIRARLATRRLVDRWAAMRVPDAATTIYAPSFAARRTFAAAALRTGAVRCVLIEDLPWLRELHDDLDRAAARHPDAHFLQRFRAPAHDLAHQEAEWVLAHEQLVFGSWALERRMLAGVPPDRVALWAWAAQSVADRMSGRAGAGRRQGPASSGRVVLLLAGPGAARGGLLEAVAAVSRIPGAELLVRGGEALEPRAVLDIPGVRTSTEEERATLCRIDAVLAPGWCEAYPGEVVLAASLGIPVIATTRAAGAVDVAACGTVVEPGDVEGLLAACRALRRTS